MRVLLVEDDTMIGEAIRQMLRDAAYAVDWVQDGQGAIDAVRMQAYDIALLDLGLPRLDGLAVLRQLRFDGNDLPILIITARDGVEDRIQGLDDGADDYLLKPFASGELLARMRALMRRKGGNAGPTMSNGVVTLDPATHNATHAGASCRLSAREFALLHTLMLRPGAIFSRSELEERIYGWNEEVESNSVEFLIHAIRKKLGADVIKNVRGVGWLVDKP